MSSKKQYQILGWAFLVLLILSVLTVIYKGLGGLLPVVLSALVLGAIMERLFFDVEIEMGKKYLKLLNTKSEQI